MIDRDRRILGELRDKKTVVESDIARATEEGRYVREQVTAKEQELQEVQVGQSIPTLTGVVVMCEP